MAGNLPTDPRRAKANKNQTKRLISLKLPPARPKTVYVVVNFLSQVIFVFLLFLVMVMYANEVETKEKQKLPEIKYLLQHISTCSTSASF